jgi:hypothetical protein
MIASAHRRGRPVAPDWRPLARISSIQMACLRGALDAKLVLFLANHIGDLDVLNEAIALAQVAP